MVAQIKTAPGAETTETALEIRAAQPRGLAINRFAFEPQSWAEAAAMSETLFRSKLMPKAVASPQAALVLIVFGRELGLTVMQSMRLVHVIEGRPSLSAEGMVGLVLASGRARYFRTIESTNASATVETQRVDSEIVERATWTTEDAQRAQLIGKDTWRKYPRAMLLHRAQAELARRVYTEIVGGIHTPEELSAGTTAAIDLGHAELMPAGATDEAPADDVATLRALYVDLREAVGSAPAKRSWDEQIGDVRSIAASDPDRLPSLVAKARALVAKASGSEDADPWDLDAETPSAPAAPVATPKAVEPAPAPKAPAPTAEPPADPGHEWATDSTGGRYQRRLDPPKAAAKPTPAPDAGDELARLKVELTDLVGAPRAERMIRQGACGTVQTARNVINGIKREKEAEETPWGSGGSADAEHDPETGEVRDPPHVTAFWAAAHKAGWSEADVSREFGPDFRPRSETAAQLEYKVAAMARKPGAGGA